MKVLYFHQHFSTPDGSTGTRSYEMARHLRRRGHAVTMVCGSYGGGRSGLSGPFEYGRRSGTVDGVRVIEFELPYSNHDGFLRRSLTFLKFALRSIGLTFTERYDLIFATSTPLTAGIPGIVARALRRKPFVFEVRDLWPELPREMGVITNPLVLKAMDILEWTSYHAANACIGLSPGIRQGIMRRGISGSRVAMIPNGCDLELFDPETVEEKRPFEAAGNDLVTVFTGAHGMANGLDALVDVAAELKVRGREDIKLVMIGDGKLKPALKKRAGEEGLDNCIFMDPVPKRKLASLVKGADVGLMLLANVPAFYYGTSPNKFFDYISMGLPVLNNYPGWLADMIGEHDCGMAVSPENPAVFADALEFMADHPADVQTMGSNARFLAEQQFDRRELADRFVDWLEKTYAAADRRN